MGANASFMSPSCFIGTGFCLALANISRMSFLLPLACELAHKLTGQLLYSEGNLEIEPEIHDVLNWNIVEFGIRCFSLNFCGKLNHIFDTIRRCLAPVSAGRSGRMVHDVIVARIEDKETKSQALVLFSKTHIGNLEVKFCRDLDEADYKGKPRVFGRPQLGWWKQRMNSHSLILKDVLEICHNIPAEYQPITNNCHHFSNNMWNWHDEKIKGVVDSKDQELPITTSTTDGIRFLSLRRRQCQVKKDLPSLISRAKILAN
eukprot:g1793.t1